MNVQSATKRLIKGEASRSTCVLYIYESVDMTAKSAAKCFPKSVRGVTNRFTCVMFIQTNAHMNVQNAAKSLVLAVALILTCVMCI